jgi:hypothetical protein
MPSLDLKKNSRHADSYSIDALRTRRKTNDFFVDVKSCWRKKTSGRRNKQTG